MQIHLLLLALTLYQSAFAQIDPQVENGVEVGPQGVLEQSVARFVRFSGACSASFLTRRTLLTAAHCAQGQQPSSTYIQLRDRQGVWHRRQIRQILVHPEYARRQVPGVGTVVANDFALIHLTVPIDVPVRPLQLVDPVRSASWIPVIITGYGLLSQSVATATLHMGRMRARVQRINQLDWAEGLMMLPYEPQHQLVCPGDSGGPVLLKDMISLIGVNSLSSGCQAEKTGVVSISSIPALVAQWIEDNSN